MKSAKELGITKTQRRNLARLAVRFRDLKRNGYKGTFDMGFYCQLSQEGDVYDVDPEESREKFHECGTCGCLLGHAPYLNIGVSLLKKVRKFRLIHRWSIFSELAFGLIVNEDNWNWLFDADWKSSKKHALKRIAWVLEKGFPYEDEFSSYTDKCPKGFKSFEPNWEEIEKAAQ